MPSTVNVKVTSVGTIVRGDKNMIEISGYDNTNNSNFKKAFFETKRDGGRTKNADISDGLQNGDWIEVVCDDTSWKNVQFIKKIAEPAGGASAPTGGGAPAKQSYSGGGSSDKMSKAEWAEKDAKKELSMARHKAIQCASDILPEGAPTKKIVDAMEKLATRFTAYILTGSFDGEVVEPAPAPVSDAQPEGNQAEGQATSPAAADDDIPF